MDVGRDVGVDDGLFTKFNSLGLNEGETLGLAEGVSLRLDDGGKLGLRDGG